MKELLNTDIKPKNKYIHYLGYSFLIAFLWQIVGHENYSYSVAFPVIFGINAYPLLVWTLGLWIFAIFFMFLSKKFSKWKLVIFSIVLYWIVLISSETIAYHYFGFRDNAVASYPGLPLCDCIHGPLWMQIVYLLMGPILIGVLLFVDKSIKFKE